MKKYFFCLLRVILIINATGISAQSEIIELVKDIHINADHEPHGLSPFGNSVLFIASDGIHGMEPWISDGTESGTFMLKDIWPGSGNSYNSSTVYLDNYWNNYFLPLNGKIVFAANDSIHGSELWITDGTPEGTNLLKDIKPGTQGAGQYSRLLFNGKMYFNADAETGFNMWVSDGTEPGTHHFADVAIGDDNSAILDGKLYFNGNTTQYGEELWVTDGTPEGTSMIKDIQPGANGSAPGYMSVYGDKLIFSADSANGGDEPFVSDGTAEGTMRLKDVSPGTGSNNSQSRYFYEFESKCYFQARGSSLLGMELWVTDGTEQGTELVIDINTDTLPANPDSSPSQFIEFNSALYFFARQGGEGGIWKIDSETTPVLFKNQAYGFFQILNGHLYFTDEDCIGKTDGTIAGTSIIPGSNGEILTFIRCGNQIFLTARFSQSTGYELYRITTATGIAENKNAFNIYPNPANELINIQIENPFCNNMPLVVTEVSGRTVINDQITSGSTACKIDMSELKSGVYFILVGNTSQRFVKL